MPVLFRGSAIDGRTDKGQGPRRHALRGVRQELATDGRRRDRAMSRSNACAFALADAGAASAQMPRCTSGNCTSSRHRTVPRPPACGALAASVRADAPLTTSAMSISVAALERVPCRNCAKCADVFNERAKPLAICSVSHDASPEERTGEGACYPCWRSERHDAWNHSIRTAPRLMSVVNSTARQRVGARRRPTERPESCDAPTCTRHA